MKIMYIWHAAVEKEYRKLLYEMVHQGHELYLVTSHRWTESSQDQKWENEGVEPRGFHAFPFKVMFRNHIRSFFFLNFIRMIALLKKVKPDVIYLKEEPYSIAAFQWTLLAQIFLPQVKILVESDENLDVSHPGIYCWMEKKVFGRIDGIASVPTAGLKLYQKRGFLGEQFKTSYFVNDNIFHPVEKKRISKYFSEISNENLALGYVGRITEEKGLDTLLEAVSLLKKRGKLKVYFLGRVTEEYKKSFDKLIETLNLKEEVILLNPHPMEHLVYFYNAIDVLVLPSRSTEWWVEQFGRVIVESQACGTPVIGSDSGEIPIVIGEDCFVFQEGNTEGLTDILSKFLSTEWKKSDFSEDLVRQVKSRFSITQVAWQKLQMMEKLVGESK